jgi:uncharacterized membrane protein YbhN (UPF0104 family)
VNPWRQRAQRWLPALVSAGALYAVLRLVDLRALADAMSWKIATLLLPAMLLYGAATLALEALCLVLLVRPRCADFGFWTGARLKSASYLLLTLHYALGVGALSVLLRRRTGLPLGEAAGITVLILAADVLIVFAFASAGVAFLGLDVPAGWILAGLGTAFVGGLALLRARGSLGPIERLRRLSFFAALRRAELKQLFQLLLLRGLFSSCFVAVYGAAFLSFELQPELARLVSGILVVAMVSGLPIAVGGLGTSQAAFLYVFRGLAEPERLLAVSLIASASMIALRVGMGLVFAREYAREALSHAGDA